MSVEAPKEAGTTAPITPQKPEGGFSRLLRKLLEVPSESQSTPQPVSRIMQPPPGLEDFAAKIQQGRDDHLSTQRQQELDRKNAVAVRLSAEVAEKAQAVAKQRELKETRVEAVTAAKKILDEFQVEEKLKYIRGTIWGGKGRIRFIEPEFERRSIYGTVEPSNRLGGLELVYQYPLFELRKSEYDLSGESLDKWRYDPKTGGTSLSIVLKEEGDKKVLNVLSKGEIGKRKEGTYVHDPHYYTYDFSYEKDGLSNSSDRFPGCDFLGISIPIATQESTVLLDLALAQEANFRITNKFLPSQLEENARRVLVEVKRRPAWRNWSSSGGL